MPTKPFMAKFDQGDGDFHYHECVRFRGSGQVWALERYERALARQTFRRAVVNKHLRRDENGYYKAA